MYAHWTQSSTVPPVSGDNGRDSGGSGGTGDSGGGGIGGDTGSSGHGEPGERSVYTVTYQENYDGADVYRTQQVNSGTKITIPDPPEHSGFAFTGWFLDASATDPFDSDDAITKNITLYAGWTKPGEHVELKDNVKQIENSESITLEADGLSATLNSENIKNLKVGDIVCIPPTDKNLAGAAIKITSIEYNTIKGKKPPASEVFDNISIHKELTINPEHIIPADGVEIKTISNTPVKPIATLQGGKTKLKVTIPPGENETVEFSVELQPTLSVDIEYGGFLGVVPTGTNVELSVDMTFEVNGKIEDKIEKKIPFGQIPILNLGVVGGHIDLYAVFKAGGELSIEAEYKFNAWCDTTGSHSKQSGATLTAQNREFSFAMTGQVGVQAKPVVTLFGFDLVDFSVEGGLEAEAKTTARQNPSPANCTDVNLFLYADAEMKILEIEDITALSAEITIFDKSNSPFKKNLHFEDFKLVPKCTWNPNSGKIREEAKGTIKGKTREVRLLNLK